MSWPNFTLSCCCFCFCVFFCLSGTHFRWGCAVFKRTHWSFGFNLRLMSSRGLSYYYYHFEDKCDTFWFLMIYSGVFYYYSREFSTFYYPLFGQNIIISGPIQYEKIVQQICWLFHCCDRLRLNAFLRLDLLGLTIFLQVLMWSLNLVF